MKTVFMFSGMGSQFWQMGADLYRHDDCFRQHADELDAMCRVRFGESILSRIHDPGRGFCDSMDEGVLSALAIFVLEQAMAETLLRRGLEPYLLLSSSLGLFAAASVAGCLDKAEALEAVCTQARLVERHCAAGAMIAVLAPVSRTQDDPALRELAEVGAVNFDCSHVLSLPATHLDLVEDRLRRLGLSFQRIPVQRAFHSRWVAAAQSAFQDHFCRIDYRRARIPMLCCSREDARLALTAGDFWCAVRQPIHFQRAVMRLEQAGPWLYVDAGPSGTLATCLKYLLPDSSTSQQMAVMTPFGGDAHRLQSLLAQAESMRKL
jgi:acyl transferase domain-containing protein